MNSVVCQSPSEGATRALGRKLGESITLGGTIFLSGELGSGKTTFVQGVAEGLGISERVTSPTFTIMAVYPILRHALLRTLVHVDLYRITYLERVTSLDLPSYEQDPTTLLLVEWPERDVSLWHNVIGKITFSSLDFSRRQLQVEGQIAAFLR